MEAASTREPGSRGFRATAATILQWIVCVFLALIALAVLSDLRRASVPDAPVVLLYITIAATALLAFIHMPPMFSRLPRRGKWVAYASILATFILFGVYVGKMNAAWERTPEGAREAAERATRQKEAARQRAMADAQEKADQDRVAADEAASRQAGLNAKRQALCEELQGNVIEMSKSNFVQVIEINDISVETAADPTKELACSGMAVVSRGADRSISFGIRTTPQGKDIITMKLN